MIFYHATTHEAARAILSAGFRDNLGAYLTDRIWTGAWVSDRPLDCNDFGGRNEAVLMITLDATVAELQQYEWAEDGKPYREWLIPAELLNAGSIELCVDSPSG